MKLLEKLFDNPKPVRWVIVGLITAFLIFAAYEAKSETRFDIGAPAISLKFSDSINVRLSERFNDKWDIGLGLIGEQVDKYDRDVDNIMYAYGQRVIRGPGIFDDVFIGIGLSYFGSDTIISGSRLNYTLLLEYNNPRKSIWPDYYIVFHISNAGIKSPNPGLNLFNFGYGFGK